MFKTKIRCFLAGLFAATLLISTLTLASGTLREVFYGVSVVVNGELQHFDDDSQPFISDGRTFLPYLPARGIFETLGFNVSWNEAARQATLSNKDVVVITVGRNTFTTNGTMRNLDVPAQIIGGRTMLPIRAVLESVGYYVHWNSDTRTVAITSNPCDCCYS